MRARRFVSMAAAASALVLLTACGTSSGDDDDAGNEQGNASTQSADSAELTGDPIVLADISQLTGIPGASFDQMGKGAQAAAEYLNANGGIEGRPVEVTTCDSKLDPGASAACGQQAIEDGAVAVQGINDAGPAGTDQLLSDAGVTQMSLPNGDTQFSDPNWYPVGGGGPAQFGSMGDYMVNEVGADNISMIVFDIPAGQKMVEQLEAAVMAAGATEFNVTFYDITATDFSAPVAKAVSTDPDAVFSVLNGGQIPIVYGLLAQQGISGDDTFLLTGTNDPKLFAAAGDATIGTRMASEWASHDDTSDPEVQLYREAMEEAGHTDLISHEWAKWGFATVMFLKTIGEDIGAEKMDAAGVKAWFEKTFAEGESPEVPVFMATPMGTSSEQYPSVRRLSANVVQWNGEKFDQVTDFFEVPLS